MGVPIHTTAAATTTGRATLSSPANAAFSRKTTWHHFTTASQHNPLQSPQQHYYPSALFMLPFYAEFSVVVSGLPSVPHPYQKKTAAHMFQQTRNLHICKTEDFHFFLPLLDSPSRTLLSNAEETKPQNAKEFKLHGTEREAFGAPCAECLAFVLCYFTHLQAAFLLRHGATSSNFLLIAAVLPAPPCLQHAGCEHGSHKWLLLPAGRAWRAYTHTCHCHALFLMQQLIVAAGS